MSVDIEAFRVGSDGRLLPIDPKVRRRSDLSYWHFMVWEFQKRHPDMTELEQTKDKQFSDGSRLGVFVVHTPEVRYYYHAVAEGASVEVVSRGESRVGGSQVSRKLKLYTVSVSDEYSVLIWAYTPFRALMRALLIYDDYYDNEALRDLEDWRKAWKGYRNRTYWTNLINITPPGCEGEAEEIIQQKRSQMNREYSVSFRPLPKKE